MDNSSPPASTLPIDFDAIKDCTRCADNLPHAPRPIVQLHSQARILIAGQAPGLKAHQQNQAFADLSGDRLRDWMGIDQESFYDPRKIAILPMGFCYPGKGSQGDLPPLKECAQTWRKPILAQLPHIKLTLVIGRYAQQYHLSESSASLTERVRQWQDYLPAVFPLPHPSPRNQRWLKNNPWFAEHLLPELKRSVAAVLQEP